jgi:sulfur carrier protein ThiS adenylyltransferase
LPSSLPSQAGDPPHVDAQQELRARLARGHVAIIGLGGLGSNAAAMLVRCGVRHLTLVDFDTVEESNLNRQLYFRDDIGRPKTESLAALLRRIEPGLDLMLISDRVEADDVVAIGGTVDVLMEAVDCADTKAMILNACAQHLPDLPVVAASGLAGSDSANSVVTEPISQRVWMVGDLTSDVTSGLPLVASRVMVAAAHEAHAVVRLLLGCDGP